MEDKKQDHIDVINIWQMIKHMFLSFLKSIHWLINFSLKHALALLAFVIVVVAAGLGIYFLQQPYYKSELFVSHTRLENYYCADMINNLNLYAKSPDKTALSQALQLSPQEAEMVKSVKYEVADENISKKYADSLSVYLPFKVVVEVYDNSILPKLQKGVLNYLESNEYALKLKEIDTSSLEKMESRILGEIGEIDSLKQIVNTSIVPRASGTGIILGEPINPVLIYDKAMDSYEKLMEVNKLKKLNNSFYPMVDFPINKRPQGMGKLEYILYGTLLGYLIGLLWLTRKSY